MRSRSPKIQTAREEHCIKIAKLHRISRRTAMPWLPDLHTPEEDLSFFRDSVFRACTIRIAEAEEGIVAFSSFRTDWLDHLYVHPDWLGRGMGSTLLNDAKSHNARLRLWVFRRNTRAIGFYENRGFLRISTTEGENEEREPDALYEWIA